MVVVIIVVVAFDAVEVTGRLGAVLVMVVVGLETADDDRGRLLRTYAGQR